MIQFHTETFQFLLDNNFEELAQAHNNEVETIPEELDINYEIYLKMDELCLLHNIAALDKNKLVGYASFTISPSMHHKHSLWATDNFYYLKPEYRQGRNTLRLFKYCEETLINRNVNYMFLTQKVKKDNSRLFSLMGFEPNTNQFFKRLEVKNG